MKITCQTCQSKYTVSDEKVQGKTVKIKCRKCGATILVNSSGVTTNGASGDGSQAAAASGGAASYLVNVSDSDQRSMSLQEIVTAYQSSVVNADTYVWADGMSDWMPLGQVPEILTELNAAASAPAAPEQAEQAAAPRAAVRREGGRRGQDLFGGGAEGQTEVAAPAASTGLSAGLMRSSSAKADENSVLFSLSALTARAGTGGGSVQQSATKEDSGLIDLKALAENAGPAAASPAIGFAADGGLFPLAVPAAPSAAQSALVAEAPPKNRAPVFIALGGAVAVAAIVGAFLFMKEGGKPPPTFDANAAASIAPPPLVPTVEAKPVESAAAAPTASASASAVATAKAVPRYTGSRPTTTKSGTSSTTKSGGTDAPKPASKPSGNCGCAPGDLMCAMKCSTKK